MNTTKLFFTEVPRTKKLNKVPDLIRSVWITMLMGVALMAASGKSGIAQAAPRAAKAQGSSSSGGINPQFGMTHLLPSPYTLPGGTLVFGSYFAYGLTDFLQVGTDLFRDIYKFYNASAKLSVIQTPEFATALTVGYENYNLREINLGNPDVRISSWQPGLVTAFALIPKVALFVGTTLNFTEFEIKADADASSGFQRGARSEVDLSWAYNPSSIGTALATGVSYDWTYQLVGYGVSHHWPGFHFGIHYYPNAGVNRIQPILAGGGSVSF